MVLLGGGHRHRLDRLVGQKRLQALVRRAAVARGERVRLVRGPVEAAEVADLRQLGEGLGVKVGDIAGAQQRDPGRALAHRRPPF